MPAKQNSDNRVIFHRRQARASPDEDSRDTQLVRSYDDLGATQQSWTRRASVLQLGLAGALLAHPVGRNGHHDASMPGVSGHRAARSARPLTLAGLAYHLLTQGQARPDAPKSAFTRAKITQAMPAGGTLWGESTSQRLGLPRWEFLTGKGKLDRPSNTPFGLTMSRCVPRDVYLSSTLYRSIESCGPVASMEIRTSTRKGQSGPTGPHNNRRMRVRRCEPAILGSSRQECD